MSFRVRRSPGFSLDWQRILDGAADGHERLTEALGAVEDALSRNPLIGVEYGSPGVRMMTARPSRMMPLRFMWYHEEGTTVVLLIGVRQLRM